MPRHLMIGPHDFRPHFHPPACLCMTSLLQEQTQFYLNFTKNV